MGAVLAGATACGFPAPAIAQGRLLVPTPAQTEGPFYPRESRRTRTPTCCASPGATARRRRARPALVSGRVLDTSGRPIPGARVEIWQCDAHGRYHHVRRERGPRPPDPNFQGFGRIVADADGRYEFRTIRPVPYPGRTPHIHYGVAAPDRRRRLITQLYVAGEPENDDDQILQGVRDAEARASIVRPFLPAPEAGLGPGGVAATFDVVLDL
jgi:protocatechuate 3,4-dioxygenase beta subunit